MGSLWVKQLQTHMVTLVLQAYKNNVKDIFKTAYNAQNNLGGSLVFCQSGTVLQVRNVGTAYGFSLANFFAATA
jgi:hypothetical protein